MKTCIFAPLNASLARTAFIAIALLGATVDAAPPVVSNVTAAQRPGTKLVDITYNLSDADGDLQNVQVQISGDAGLTYTIPATALSGAVGGGIVPGNNRAIVWNAGVDWNGQYVPLAKVRVTAFDGTTPPPPPGMVYIQGGAFQMGDNLDGQTNSMPVHNVQVNGFFMDRTELTREQILTVQTWGTSHGYSMGNGDSRATGHPVRTISWTDAVKWCNARSEMEGLIPVYYSDDLQTMVFRSGTSAGLLTNSKVKWTANGYRLPTEAEWEKAARGGSSGLRYPWGNTVAGDQANYNNSGDPTEGVGPSPHTTPVAYYNGSQTPVGADMGNGYGLYDMAGNVWEWCWDRYDSAFYGTGSAGDNPRGPDGGGTRVRRGGSCVDGSSFLRVSYRDGFNPDNLYDYIGFRCVRGL